MMDILTPKEIFDRHPLPWTAHSLMIKDANDRQVIHLGGAPAEFGSRPEDPYYLAGLNVLLVALANETLKPGTVNSVFSKALTPHEIFILHFNECQSADCMATHARDRFKALKAAERLKLDHIDGREITTNKADILKILLSELEYWKNADSSVSIGAIGALSNTIAAITANHRAPWHPKKPTSGTFDLMVICSGEAEVAIKNGWKVGTYLRCQEEKHSDRYFQITAIGMQQVLGAQIKPDGKLGTTEFHLSLRDEFLTWTATSKDKLPRAITS